MPKENAGSDLTLSPFPGLPSEGMGAWADLHQEWTGTHPRTYQRRWQIDFGVSQGA